MVDWFHYLFRTVTALAIGFSAIELIDRLLDKKDPRIQKTVDEIRKSIVSDWKNRFNDSVEECITNMRKDYQVEIEKKRDDDQKACSDSLEECLSNVRKVLEASYEDRFNGTLNDEKLLSDVNKCLTDIKKLIELDAK